MIGAMRLPERSRSQVEQFFNWKKVRVEMCEMRRGAKAPAQVNSEAAPQLALTSLGYSPKTYVMYS